MVEIKIAIIGYGFVGQSFERMIQGHYQTLIYDPKKECSVDKDQINQCDLAVIAVPTPSLEDGGCDTSLVEESVNWLRTPVILIKSTVIPGTTDRLREKTKKRIVFSPEYIGEGKYQVSQRLSFQNDMSLTPFLILGGSEADCNYVLDLLVPVLGPEKTYYKTKALEAELIKYMTNAYFCVKLTFMNEMYEISKKLGADWYSVWQGFVLDPRVELMHTAIFPKSRGFSGKCLPKDIKALVKLSSNEGYQPEFLIQTIMSNSKFKGGED